MSRTVAIDGHNIALQHGTGVATYARNLADCIAGAGWNTTTLYGAPISPKLNDLLREISFFDYLGGNSPHRSTLDNVIGWTKEAVVTPFGLHASDIPITGRVEAARFKGRLPARSDICNIENLFNVAKRHFIRHKKFLEVRLSNPPDIMHWTYPLPIKMANVPNVYTIHDLVPLRLPYTTLDNKRYYHRLIKGCLKNAAQICTVSEKSKQDILSLFDVQSDFVTNTYQAVDTGVESEQKSQQIVESEVKGIYGLAPRSYFLFFGAIEPKKNVGRLIEAFLSVQLDAPLVIVGSLAWKSEEEMKLINSMLKQRPDLKRRVRIFDYAPRKYLINLIRCAKAVVFPSLYEGFGLPLLEAMQLGTPTLCSTEGSLPEIVGDASLQVDPYDIGAIAQGLVALDQNDDLRKRLTVAGRTRSKFFSVAAYETRLMQMYSKLC